MMASLSKSDIDGIFQALSDKDVASELNRQAKELFVVAEQSEHFRTVVSTFLHQSMTSLTVAGVIPKPVAMQVLVAFLMGVRHCQSTHAAGAGDPQIDPDFVDKMLKHMEKENAEGEG